jgi:membrane protein
VTQHAPTPVDVPAPRWRTVLWRVWTQLNENHVSMLAAGVAFYAFLSLFPGLVALVALYGLIADPVAVEANIASLGGVVPEAAQSVLNTQLKALSSHSGTTLSLTLVVSLLFAWWSAASAMKALMESLNVAYGVVERRGIVRFNLEALVLTLGAIGLMVLALLGLIVVPIVLRVLAWLGLPSDVVELVADVRWPVLAAFVQIALGVLYRYGPSGRARREAWLSWGALIATVLWLIGSGLLSLYVATFDTLNKTYGSLAAVVVLMLWLELSALLVIVGGQFNAELERTASRDAAIRDPGTER